MNGTHKDTDFATDSDFNLSDNEDDDSQDSELGDYSARLEELMSDGEDDRGHAADEDEEADRDAFIYNGVDSDPTMGYREQLRDVLGPDHEEDELEEEHEVELSLVHEVAENEKFAATIEDEAGHVHILSSLSPSPIAPKIALPSTLSRMSGQGNGIPPHLPSARPYLHPSISRLRSITPQPSSSSSAASAATLHSQLHESTSAAPSHFSALSRSSSVTNLSTQFAHQEGSPVVPLSPPREVLQWTQLRIIGEHIYAAQGPKISAVLGAQSSGSPTVLAANGLICIGTDTGRVLVFDFKQTLKCICGTESSGEHRRIWMDPPFVVLTQKSLEKNVGTVTALALSFDHTYIAAGHATGYIQLYDLRSPKVPARTVAPTTLTAVASGRQEGHLIGSRIVSIGFIAGRHTALVSADESGLAFYHSLGRVLFVDATDILRILGKYPDEDLSDTPTSLVHRVRRRRSRKPATILSMAPLPLGTASHPTDTYNLIALLTPIKLVIVGLKPSPKTWYRRHRESEGEVNTVKSRFKGCLAWFPSVSLGADLASAPERNNKKSQTNGVHPISTPTLVYSWGAHLHLLRVFESKMIQAVKDPRSGKLNKVEVGRIVFEEVGSWMASDDILALQWLNVNQILLLTHAGFEIYDVRTFKLVEHESYDAWALVSPVLSHTTNGAITYSDAVSEVAHSVRVYKGKIFLLGQHGVQVGTLLTWADRILHFVEEGDFLSAIDLTRSYYVGDAPGNRNGLPDDPEKIKAIVGQKLRDFMAASARYAFSEERLTDSTHVTLDGRGVDRTQLFEGLVSTCARACMALHDYEFFFEDLFQYYDNNGIAGIFLSQLEPFMLDGDIRQVPPRVTQRLVAYHADANRSDLVERLIWHIDPECLDINQAITLCQQYNLYDALIYVYTRALQDYVAPVVELLGLVRGVQRYRKQRAEAEGSPIASDDEIEPIILNAYKIYPFIADTLTGLTYPSEEPLPEDEAFAAKNAVYTFLFFGRSSVWPEGEGGKLVLTSDEESGVEPTYPYTRLLLRFDPEAFLHTLDLAFEDAYLNDDTRGVSRLVIVKILLEILASPDLSPGERTFTHIFIARNVPKYPQFIQIQPSALHNILIGLAEDPDTSTREDRQLAAEFLLSAYTPHESERIFGLFKHAGFYRILRFWYRQERRWSELIATFLEDPDLPRSDIFTSIDNVLVTAKRSNKGKLSGNLTETLKRSLPALLDIDISSTAALVDAHLPALHDAALENLGSNSDQERFIYLQHLLQPSQRNEDEHTLLLSRKSSSLPPNLPLPLRLAFVSLHCRFEPSGLIAALRHLPPNYLHQLETIQICEEHEVFDAVIWLIDQGGDPRTALSKAKSFDVILSARIAAALATHDDLSQDKISEALHKLKSIAGTSTTICLERSQVASSEEVSLEDLWFQLLSSQIDCVQRVASCCSLEALGPSDGVPSEDPQILRENGTISALRSLVHQTFSSLMSVSSTRAVSFPRLFKRLVGSASSSNGNISKGTLYTEFRTILTGMLESFRSEGDMLVITKHLVDRDVADTVAELVAERMKGWAPTRGACSSCGVAFASRNLSEGQGHGEVAVPASEPIVVSRTGAIYHTRCLPTVFHANTIVNVH